MASCLEGIGVVEKLAVARLLRSQQILEPESLLALDGDDIGALFASKMAKGMSVGDRAKLKKAIRNTGHPPTSTPLSAPPLAAAAAAAAAPALTTPTQIQPSSQPARANWVPPADAYSLVEPATPTSAFNLANPHLPLTAAGPKPHEELPQAKPILKAQSRWSALRTSDLRKKVLGMGIDAALIEKADDADDRKLAFTDLIVTHEKEKATKPASKPMKVTAQHKDKPMPTLLPRRDDMPVLPPRAQLKPLTPAAASARKLAL